MDITTLGKRIKKHREKQGLTQAQVANSLQITAQAVSKWERGENAPDIGLLKKLSSILGVTTDWLLSGAESGERTFSAVVFCSSIRGFAKTSSEMSPKDIALGINGVFHVLTESVLEQGGIPVKYVGDGFLAYFTGNSDTKRSFAAALSSARALNDKNILITLNKGEIFLGAIGHHEYSRPDIMGETVNEVFLLNQWATINSSGNILITENIFNSLTIYNNLKIRPINKTPENFSGKLYETVI